MVFAGSVTTAQAQPASTEAVASAQTEVRVGPRLEYTPLEADFGLIDDSRPVSLNITLTNTGDERLEIPEQGGIRGSCGCTIPTPPQYTLEPGESMELKVEFDPKGRHGPQAKTVTINSNVGTPTVIPVKSHIIRRVLFVEGNASIGQIDEGDTKTVRMHVQGMDESFRVTEATTNRPDAIRIEIVGQEIIDRENPVTGQITQVGQTAVDVTLLTTAPIGRLNALLEIVTTDAEVQEHSTNIAADVRADIRLAPTSIRLGAIAPGDTVEESVALFSNKKREFSIQNVVFVSSDLSAEDRARFEVTHEPLPEDDERHGYLVTIRGDVTDTMRLIRGRLVIVTDSPTQKVVTGAVAGVVRAQAR